MAKKHDEILKVHKKISTKDAIQIIGNNVTKDIYIEVKNMGMYAPILLSQAISLLKFDDDIKWTISISQFSLYMDVV